MHITELDDIEDPLYRALGLLGLIVRLCDQVPPDVRQIDLNPEHLSIALSAVSSDVELSFQRLTALFESSRLSPEPAITPGEAHV